MTTSRRRIDPTRGGYRSAADKNSFQILVFVLAGATVVIPMVIAVAMTGTLPGAFASSFNESMFDDLPEPSVRSVVRWQGETWLISEDWNSEGSGLAKLKEGELVTVANGLFEGDDAGVTNYYTLIPDGDGLWLVSPERIYLYQNDELQTHSSSQPAWAETATFFLHQGRLTAVAADVDEFLPLSGDAVGAKVTLQLYQWHGDHWLLQGEVAAPTGSSEAVALLAKEYVVDDLSVFEAGPAAARIAMTNYEDQFRQDVSDSLQAVSFAGRIQTYWLFDDGRVMERIGWSAGVMDGKDPASTFKPDKGSLKAPLPDDATEPEPAENLGSEPDSPAEAKEQVGVDQPIMAEIQAEEGPQSSDGWRVLEFEKDETFWEIRVAAIGDDLFLLRDISLEDDDESAILDVSRVVAGRCESVARIPIEGFVYQFQIVADDKADTCRVYFEDDRSIPGYVDVDLKSGAVSDRESVGKSSGELGNLIPQKDVNSQLISMIASNGMLVLFVIAASFVVKSYRSDAYHWKISTARQASLWRRAAAKIVDSVFYLAPIGALGYSALRDFDWRSFDVFEFFEELDPNIILMALAYMGAAFVWMFVVAILFSLLEGMTGKTPGKWLLGIEVRRVTLERCGFWRALLRRGLMVIDMMWNWMVGMVMIALTEKQQRLGDMAAKTVVIRSGTVRSGDDLDGPDSFEESVELAREF